MLVSIDEARRAANHALRRLSVTIRQRDQIVTQLLYAEARGKRTHGLIRIPWLIQVLKGRRHRPPSLCNDNQLISQYDGQDSVGYLAADELTRRVVRKTRSTGVAVVACRNLFPSGVLGFHVAEIARHGLVGCVLATTPPLVSVGERTRVIGTNPVAFGHQTAKGDLFIVDVSCAPATFGHALLAMWDERSPLEHFRTARGKRPKSATELFTEAGTFSGSIAAQWSHPLQAKLIALSLAIDVGVRCATGDGTGSGSLVLAAAMPEKFSATSREALDRRVADLMAATGMLPGQRSEARARDRLRIPRALWNDLLRTP